MVARHYDVNANQVFRWRKHYRDQPYAPTGRSSAQLIPVVVTAAPDSVTPSAVAEKVEIDVAGKYRVRVGSGVDVQTLRRVLDVLEQR
ncbi:MAG: hypothetical protein ACLPKB_02180 [Xanthobacteraceae bacterium]